MALPVKRRGSQTSRASWIGLAQARSSLRGVFTGRITGADHWGGSLGRITGADVLRRNQSALAALALAACQRRSGAA